MHARQQPEASGIVRGLSFFQIRQRIVRRPDFETIFPFHQELADVHDLGLAEILSLRRQLAVDDQLVRVVTDRRDDCFGRFLREIEFLFELDGLGRRLGARRGAVPDPFRGQRELRQGHRLAGGGEVVPFAGEL